MVHTNIYCIISSYLFKKKKKKKSQRDCRKRTWRGIYILFWYIKQCPQAAYPNWTKHVTSQQINIKCLLECEYNQPS